MEDLKVLKVELLDITLHSDIPKEDVMNKLCNSVVVTGVYVGETDDVLVLCPFMDINPEYDSQNEWCCIPKGCIKKTTVLKEA
jgi:hypothetical protein